MVNILASCLEGPEFNSQPKATHSEGSHNFPQYIKVDAGVKP